VAESQGAWDSGGPYVGCISAPRQSRLSGSAAEGQADAQAFAAAMLTAYHAVGPLQLPSGGRLYCWLDQEYSTSLSSNYWNAWANYIAEYNFASLGIYPLYPCLYCNPNAPYPSCSTIAKARGVNAPSAIWSSEPEPCGGPPGPSRWDPQECGSAPTKLWQYGEQDACSYSANVDLDLGAPGFAVAHYCFYVKSRPLAGSWVIDINQVTESVISGCAVSCGAFLVVAGASKLYRSTRALEDMTAIRRALRMPRRQWRLFGLAAGTLECVTGLLVCSGASPVLGGAGLAGLGAVFCVLLAYVLVKQIPGGCGCIGWRTAPETAAEAVTWRAMARGGTLLGAGIAYMLVSADAPRGEWFGGGVVASVTVLVLLNMQTPVRTPVCRRPLWHQTRTTLRALTSHQMFAAMAASAGPFEPLARYRRTGCADEFWFAAVTGSGSEAVVFQVHQTASGARLAVHTSLRDTRTPGTTWPARAIAVPDVPPRGTRAGGQLRSRKRSAVTAAGRFPATAASSTGFSAADGGAPSSRAGKPPGQRRETQ
jgi:hypothetical protein